MPEAELEAERGVGKLESVEAVEERGSEDETDEEPVFLFVELALRGGACGGSHQPGRAPSQAAKCERRRRASSRTGWWLIEPGSG